MKDSIEERVKLVKEAEDSETLKKHLCPFFEKGGHTDCIACRKTESDLEACRDYYLERIAMFPMDIWSESFDKVVFQDRDSVDIETVVGIGINCDSCYMSDKCPMFRRGYVCGIKWDTNKPNNPTEFMDFLISTQYERVRRAAVFEKIDGGVPDANLSTEMDRLSDYINTKDNMGRDRLSINVEASGAARPEGGILAKLFGGPPKLESAPVVKEIPQEVIEVTPIEEVKPLKKRVKNERD